LPGLAISSNLASSWPIGRFTEPFTSHTGKPGVRFKLTDCWLVPAEEALVLAGDGGIISGRLRRFT
jgi:hypothetical protein